MEKFTQAPVGLDIDQTVSGHTDDISNLADGMGIVANGNTHAAVANGQAVFVKNHSSLADGLYWAKAAIAADAALSTSNLTPDDSGGLNKLKTDIDALNSKYVFEQKSSAGVSVNAGAVSDYDIDVTKTGYKAVGVVGTVINGGGGCGLVSSYVVSNTSVRVRIRNNGSSAVTPSSVDVQVLYEKT